VVDPHPISIHSSPHAQHYYWPPILLPLSLWRSQVRVVRKTDFESTMSTGPTIPTWDDRFPSDTTVPSAIHPTRMTVRASLYAEVDILKGAITKLHAKVKRQSATIKALRADLKAYSDQYDHGYQAPGYGQFGG
jgi:hypothetical protein